MIKTLLNHTIIAAEPYLINSLVSVVGTKRAMIAADIAS